MQAPTHVLTGVLVQKAFQKIKSKPLRVSLIAISALLLHSIMDRIARLTYHPPNADFSDPFWVTYHAIIFVTFIAAIYIFWREYKLGIFFSILPDFDWVFIHGSRIFGFEIPFYNTPRIHTVIHYVIDNMPPFSLLQYLPDRTHSAGGIAIEVVLIIIMLLIVWKTANRKAIIVTHI